MKSGRMALIFGIVLACIAAPLIFMLLNSSATVQSEPHRTVYVAAQDIQARAPITSVMTEPVSRPISGLDPDAITNKQSLENTFALISIPAGSVMTRSKVARIETSPLTSRMPAGTRAMSIAVDEVRGVSGLIQPGDRVDIMGIQGANTFTPGSSSVSAKGIQTFLRGVLVLAVGGLTEADTPAGGGTPPPATNGSGPANTITLAVTPAQAVELALAEATSTLRITLRPAREKLHGPIAVPYHVVHQVSITPAIVQPAPVAPAEVKPATNAATTASPKPKAVPAGIPIIDGDHLVGNAHE